MVLFYIVESAAFILERFSSITHNRCMDSALAAELVSYSALFSLFILCLEVGTECSVVPLF